MSALPAIASPLSAPLQTAEALGLECVSFEVAPGIAPSGKPPVRIFLGSEEAQQRAERVFLYAVQKLRDASRVYRVYLMKDLPGFERRAWRTGFTHYRFAIPELAGGSGRAIYNDVDQVYLADPAALLDLDLQGHGYAAVAANDTSVMLIDCARMLHWWNLEAARRHDKRALVQVPATQPGLWAPLDGAWNARDFEYRAGVSRLLHYTTLHLQPWHPTPEQYSYHPHPLGELWLGLEREADARGYQPFSAGLPSGAYRRLAGAGAAPRLPLAAQAVVTAERLEQLPPEDLPWFLDALFAQARKSVQVRVDLRQAMAPHDRPAPPRLALAAQWWRERLAAAAERRPAIGWQLDLVERSGRRRSYRYEPASGLPRLWVLLGAHEGDNRQLLALAEALGWPYEPRRLVFKPRSLLPAWLLGASLLRLDRGRSDPLAAPWPDVVLACGRRSAPVARWIGRCSAGASRLVQLGRPRAPLDAFDLVITTPQYGLPARANVVHNVLPLNRSGPPQTAGVAAAWRARLAPLPRPRIAVLVGGNSSSCELSEETARRLRERAHTLARERRGSLLIATSPRTPAAAADILLAESDVPGARYRWRSGDPENPYAVFLEQADELIVTADSASMLAEACATGRPVRYVPLPPPARPRRSSALVLGFLERQRRRVGERGTPRQQRRLGRWLDALIASGVVRRPRDLGALHEALRWTRRAQPIDDPDPSAVPAPDGDLQRTVDAVRRMLLRGRALQP